MALAGVLSAVRELVLDFDVFPDSVEQRCRLYQGRFTELTFEECQDLAAIEPLRLKKYTTSIFQGEYATLRTHFPISVSILKNIWDVLFGTKFDGFAYVRALHSARPWRSIATDALASNFVDYLTCDSLKVVQLVPYLPEVALMELTSLRTKRHVMELPPSIGALELNQLTVDECLALKVRVPASLTLCSFSHRVIDLWRARIAGGIGFEKLEADACLAAASRDVNRALRWTDLSSGVYEYLQSLSENGVGTLEELAPAILQDCPAQGELEQLEYLLTRVVAFVDAGVLVV